MKKVISLLAAVTIVFSGMGSLAVDASAVNITTAATAKATTTKSTTRTGKQLTYQQAYDRLKNLSFATGKAPDTTANTNTTKPATTTNNTNQNKPSNTTNQNNSANTAKNNAPTMTDHKGKALSSEMYVRRNTLNKDQLYLYDTIKTAALNGDSSAKFNKAYSDDDINTAVAAVMADNPYMVWVKAYRRGVYAKTGYTSVNIDYVTDLVKDKAGALQTMNDYLKPMLDKASKMTSDIDKVKFVHDWIIYNVKEGSAVESNMYYHGAYAAAVDKRGVCQAYSNLFVYCMQKLGIVATNLHGTTWNGESHIWNMVKVGGEWYELDVYWDDLITKSETDFNYECFMQTTESLKAYDTYNGVSRTRNSDDGSTLLPIAKGTKYSPSNYNYDYGSNFNDLPKVVLTKRSKSYTSVTVNSNNAYAKNTSTNKSSNTKLPSGWYNYSKVLTKLGVKSLKESDWTKDGDFYFIERKINGKGCGQYVVYDVAYDNYYTWGSGGKTIMWYNYKKSAWQRLS